MTRSDTAAPDPAAPHHRPAPNLKVPGTFRFDLRDAVPFAHLPETLLVLELRRRALVRESRA